MKRLLTVLGAVAALGLLYWFPGRAWYSRWGASEADTRQPLPGDEIVPDANLVSTRAVTIHAPAERVYPWLLQMGKDRGGMYSYEWMENLVGCDIHNVYEIVPELQQVQVGQAIHMGPEGYPLYHVYAINPGQSFILRPADPVTKQPGPASWAMVLQDQGNGTTRMLFRQRQRVEAGLGNFVMWRVMIDPISFVMEQKMMRTIKGLAEGRLQSF